MIVVKTILRVVKKNGRTWQTSAGGQMYRWKISGFYRAYTNTCTLERGRHAFEIFLSIAVPALSATLQSLNDFPPRNVTLHIVWCKVTSTFDFIRSNGLSASSQYVDRQEFSACEYWRPYLRKNYSFKTINKRDVLSFQAANGKNIIMRKSVWKNVFFLIEIHFSNRYIQGCFKRFTIIQYGVWVKLKS